MCAFDGSYFVDEDEDDGHDTRQSSTSNASASLCRNTELTGKCWNDAIG